MPDKGIAMLLGEGIHMSGRLLGRGGITRGRITRETLPWTACLDLACSLWLQLELAGAIGREGSCCFVFMSSPSEASQTDVVKQEYPAIPRGEAQKNEGQTQLHGEARKQPSAAELPRRCVCFGLALPFCGQACLTKACVLLEQSINVAWRRHQYVWAFSCVWGGQQERILLERLFVGPGPVNVQGEGNRKSG